MAYIKYSTFDVDTRSQQFDFIGQSCFDKGGSAVCPLLAPF